MTITGAGSLNTIIDAGTPPSGLAPEVHGLDRLFDVHPTAKSTTITGLTVRDGYTPEAAAAPSASASSTRCCLPPNPGTLRLVDVSVLDNYAGEYGGGVHVIGRGRLEVIDSTLSGNGASAGGAAINNTQHRHGRHRGQRRRREPRSRRRRPDRSGRDHAHRPDRLPDRPRRGQQPGRHGHDRHDRRAPHDVHRQRRQQRRRRRSTTAATASSPSRSRTSPATSPRRPAAPIYSAGGTLTIEDSEFEGNRAHDGGAVYFDGEITDAGTRPLFEITDSEFDDNHVEASGGAIVSDGDGELIITGTDFTENFAPDEGGAIIGGGRSSIDVTDSRFVGNQSSGSGGAVIFEGERSGSVIDTLFRENVAGVSSVDELGFPVEGDGTGGGLHTGGVGAVHRRATRRSSATRPTATAARSASTAPARCASPTR